LHKDYLPSIKEKNAPLIGLLNGSIMEMFNNTFSEHMSEYMSLYEVIEDPEVKCYNKTFDAYYRLLVNCVQKIIYEDMLVYYKTTLIPHAKRQHFSTLSPK
jgi:hypothetical protein